ncbi:dermonecrotic toxin domain-containing protein [Erwinia amylovora]|uniref:dermonecrotic toxin domain-containing protein n=1 Tax=Erwinia amylovora TaxID=552 RepID=UPI001443C8F1|nr:DUF6543 domain-containing protein [Erwinia amylovora]
MPIPSHHRSFCGSSNQSSHDDFVRQMANNPGRNSSNIIRQDLSKVFLHCLFQATSSQQSDSTTASSGSSLTAVIYPSAHHAVCASQYALLRSRTCSNGTKKIQNNHCPSHLTNERSQAIFQAIDKLTRLQTADPSFSEPDAKIILPGHQPVTTAKRVGDSITALLNKIERIAYQASEFISYYDPLRIQQVQAFSYHTKKQVQEKLNPWITNDGNDTKTADTNQINYNEKIEPDLRKIIDAGQKEMSRFYHRYNEKYPTLKQLASTILKEKIKQRFHLTINPDQVYFMQFEVSIYEGDKLLQYGPPVAKKTLTEYLFTNFGREVQDYLVNVDVASGIYDISQVNFLVHDSSDAIKIKPTDFIQLIWDIDFYNYAKVKFTDYFNHKDDHIKNHFLSFINHLDSSQIDSDSARDVLNGVGVLKDNNVSVILFDINQYSAANAFVYRNKDNNRVTLYFPASDFKFISFRGDFEMRAWVANACATEEHRKMLAAHFTIANRQDGLFYYGVDAWLNSINLDNDYCDRIAITSTEVPSAHFFTVLYNNIKAKTFSDLDSQIKSDAEVRRDMWEEMADASNILPNPVSPFLSLAMHIEHAINADTYAEKMQEWSKIKNDIVNLIALVILDKTIKLSDIKGYEFIDAVVKGFDEENIRGLSKMLQESGEPSLPGYHIFDPQSPGWNWLFDDEENAPPSPQNTHLTVNEDQYCDPGSPSWGWLFEEKQDPPLTIRYLTRFLPPKSIPHTSNIELLDHIIGDHIYKDLQENAFDVYYGLENHEVAIPEYIKHARIRSRTALESAKEHVKSAFGNLNNLEFENNIKAYLSTALDTSDPNILTEAVLRLQYQVQRADSYLIECESRGFENIGFVSTRQVVNRSNKFLFRSKIKDMAYLKSLPLGFSSKFDPHRRIFLMLDASQELRASGDNILNRNIDLVDGVFIHEASHLSSDTMDFCYNECFDRVFDPGNPTTILEKFNHKLTNNLLKENKDFEVFMREAYKYLGITTPYNANVANKMVIKDPMLKANMLMNNADSFVTFVKYLSALNNNIRHTRSVNKKYDIDIDIDIDTFIMLILTSSRDHFLSALNLTSR